MVSGYLQTLPQIIHCFLTSLAPAFVRCRSIYGVEGLQHRRRVCTERCEPWRRATETLFCASFSWGEMHATCTVRGRWSFAGLDEPSVRTWQARNCCRWPVPSVWGSLPASGRLFTQSTDAAWMLLVLWECVRSTCHGKWQGLGCSGGHLCLSYIATWHTGAYGSKCCSRRFQIKFTELLLQLYCTTVPRFAGS